MPGQRVEVPRVEAPKTLEIETQKASSGGWGMGPWRSVSMAS